MQRSGPAASNHRAVGQFLTAFDRVHSGGVGHVLFHDFDNTECGAERVQAEPFADTLRQCPFSGISVEPHSAAREPIMAQSPNRQIRIGDRGMLAATAVTGGPGLGSCTMRANVESTLAIDPPPAPISTISITGMRIGIPLPLRNRYCRATSKVREKCGCPSSMRQIFAVVPPMSNETIRSMPYCAARRVA